MDEDILEVQIVLHQVVQVVRLKGQLEPLGQSVDVVLSAGVAYEQQLATLFDNRSMMSASSLK